MDCTNFKTRITRIFTKCNSLNSCNSSCMEKEKLRIDKYLWAIRLFKTRSQAGDACDKGKVKLNGVSIKASRIVAIGDEYEAKTEARKWVVKVTGLLHSRVQY